MRCGAAALARGCPPRRAKPEISIEFKLGGARQGGHRVCHFNTFDTFQHHEERAKNKIREKASPRKTKANYRDAFKEAEIFENI